MANESVKQKEIVSSSALIILVAISIAAIISTLLTFVYPDTIAAFGANGFVFDAIFVILTVATYALYLLGGGVIAFGAILITIRFIKIKTENPYQKTSSAHQLSGYLTLGLNFFIGAEIIRTVAVRTTEEFLLLMLTIFSRGLLTLILYLEERWHGTGEAE